jgi:hypothetical protein
MISGQAAHVIPSILRMTLRVTARPGFEMTSIVNNDINKTIATGNLFIFFPPLFRVKAWINPTTTLCHSRSRGNPPRLAFSGFPQE